MGPVCSQVPPKLTAHLLCFSRCQCNSALALFPFPGTLTVEQIYQDRDQFAKLVREVAAPDVGRMGIEILSFTIKVQPGKGNPTAGQGEPTGPIGNACGAVTYGS
ncbi:hypothetical protein KIL84_000267 [Mauremys mutica]|uniref:Flotillin n=1 Tax=Mauremys mutica TaxID=74926 RepID=A0A9D4B3E2_9SAUR|nr:hypothetical protein KIL84_000267 [Mauremys mutica]